MDLAWLKDIVKWLSFYMNRIVPLLSLFMYLILAIFSGSRRREGKGWTRSLVWLAYQLTDWGPTYIIGNLYAETSLREQMIVAFWVPFLLQHIALPDNISAYTIEDNELWLRLIVSVSTQSMISIIIVYRYILSDGTTGLLRQVSFIMLLLGLFKYVETAAALWLCNLNDYGGSKNLDNLKDDEALLVAHSLFDICRGAFSDYSVEYMDHGAICKNMFSGQWESMCKVVEMELSLMYDILYTKAVVAHTWHGYAIRLASPFLTATALLLFGLHGKEGIRTIDEVISYVLLLTTLLLDMRWLLRALASAWTHSFFKLMPHNWLKHEIWCRGRWQNLRRFVVSLRLFRLTMWFYRRWVGTIGQHNLLDQCTAVLGGHSRGLEIPEYVKKLVFSYICEMLFPWEIGAGMTNAPFEENKYNAPARPHHCPDEEPAKYAQSPPEHYEQVNLWRHIHNSLPSTDRKSVDIKPMNQSDYPPELQEAILIWHIATDVFLSCSPRVTGAKSNELKKAVKHISDYMMFLVARRPKMIPGLIIRSLYKKTRDKLEEKRVMADTKHKEGLAKWMMNNLDDLKDEETTDTIWEGTQLARVLLRLVPRDRDGQHEVSVATEEEAEGTAERLAYWLPDFSVLKFIMDAWVRVLMYTSIRCSRDSYAKQLSCGGELTTLVWIITQHAEVSIVKKHLQPLLRRKNNTV
ncbi:hypothetical protein VPH35_004837 [Triticum aestivum]